MTFPYIYSGVNDVARAKQRLSHPLPQPLQYATLNQILQLPEPHRPTPIPVLGAITPMPPLPPHPIAVHIRIKPLPTRFITPLIRHLLPVNLLPMDPRVPNLPPMAVPADTRHAVQGADLRLRVRHAVVERGEAVLEAAFVEAHERGLDFVRVGGDPDEVFVQFVAVVRVVHYGA